MKHSQQQGIKAMWSFLFKHSPGSSSGTNKAAPSKPTPLSLQRGTSINSEESIKICYNTKLPNAGTDSFPFVVVVFVFCFDTTFSMRATEPQRIAKTDRNPTSSLTGLKNQRIRFKKNPPRPGNEKGNPGKKESKIRTLLKSLGELCAWQT